MTSTGYLGKQTNWETDVVGNQAQQAINEQWGPIPGEIKSYDAATQTATVKPLYKPLHNGEPVEMPELYEVPVELPRTANAGLTMPIPAGTKVMLNPSMRSRESYDDANDGKPSDGRTFHLADMRATINGGDSLTDPLPNVDPDNTHLRFDAQGQYGLKGSPDGKVRLDGAVGNIYDLLATAIELIASDQLQINYGSSAGTGHALQHAAALQEIAGKLRAMQL